MKAVDCYVVLYTPVTVYIVELATCLHVNLVGQGEKQY